MSPEPIPKAAAAKVDFEFEAPRQTRNDREALIAEFGEFLHGHVIEVGAGVGQMIAHLRELPGLPRLIAFEPDARQDRSLSAGRPAQYMIKRFRIL